MTQMLMVLGMLVAVAGCGGSDGVGGRRVDPSNNQIGEFYYWPAFTIHHAVGAERNWISGLVISSEAPPAAFKLNGIPLEPDPNADGAYVLNSEILVNDGAPLQLEITVESVTRTRNLRCPDPVRIVRPAEGSHVQAGEPILVEISGLPISRNWEPDLRVNNAWQSARILDGKSSASVNTPYEAGEFTLAVEFGAGGDMTSIFPECTYSSTSHLVAVY